jgi:rhodanese-related sulfurtransferase
VAQQLKEMGLEAMALVGGFTAWRSQFPIEPITAAA